MNCISCILCISSSSCYLRLNCAILPPCDMTLTFSHDICSFLKIKVIPFEVVPLECYAPKESFYCWQQGCRASTGMLVSSSVTLFCTICKVKKKKSCTLSMHVRAEGIKRSHRDWDPVGSSLGELRQCVFVAKNYWWKLPCDMMNCNRAVANHVQCLAHFSRG